MSQPQPNAYSPASQPSQPALKSGFAVTALICGIFSPIAWFGSHHLALGLALAAVVCAILALRNVNRGVGSGRGMAVWGLVLGLLFSLAGLGSLGGTKPATTSTATASPSAASATSADTTTAARPSQPTVISVTAMGDDFERNQVAAEKKWGGQYIQFTAPVGNINSSSVSFTKVTSAFSFTQVSCQVKDESAVLNLAKGQNATVRGIVGGDQMLGVISLDGCEVLSK